MHVRHVIVNLLKLLLLLLLLNAFFFLTQCFGFNCNAV